MASLQLYNPPTPFAEVKTLSKHLEASYTLYGSQLILRISTNHQHALRKSKRTLLSLLRPFALVKTDPTRLYKLLMRLAVVKSDSPNFYKPPTRFVEVKLAFFEVM